MLSQSIIATFTIALIAASVNADQNSCPTFNVPSSSCGDGKAIPIRPSEQQSIVEAVNAHRRSHNDQSKKVRWSNQLAERAQLWANQCPIFKIPSKCNPLGVHQLVYKGLLGDYPYEVITENKWENETILKPPSNNLYLYLDKVGCGRLVVTEVKYIVCNFNW